MATPGAMISSVVLIIVSLRVSQLAFRLHGCTVCKCVSFSVEKFNIPQCHVDSRVVEIYSFMAAAYVGVAACQRNDTLLEIKLHALSSCFIFWHFFPRIFRVDFVRMEFIILFVKIGVFFVLYTHSANLMFLKMKIFALLEFTNRVSSSLIHVWQQNVIFHVKFAKN